jgi:hypothetical protein
MRNRFLVNEDSSAPPTGDMSYESSAEPIKIGHLMDLISDRRRHLCLVDRFGEP